MSATFKMIGDFKRAMRIAKEIGPRIEAVCVPSFDAVGKFYAQEVVRGLDSQAPAGERFEPLKAKTIEARARKRGKASTKALIDTGDLRNSVTHEPLVHPLGVFVGLLRTVMHPETGQPVANLGEIHEHGVPYGIGSKIPARPFLGPIARSRSIRRRAVRVFASQVRRRRAMLTR